MIKVLSFHTAGFILFWDFRFFHSICFALMAQSLRLTQNVGRFCQLLEFRLTATVSENSAGAHCAVIVNLVVSKVKMTVPDNVVRTNLDDLMLTHK